MGKHSFLIPSRQPSLSPPPNTRIVLSSDLISPWSPRAPWWQSPSVRSALSAFRCRGSSGYWYSLADVRTPNQRRPSIPRSFCLQVGEESALGDPSARWHGVPWGKRLLASGWLSLTNNECDTDAGRIPFPADSGDHLLCLFECGCRSSTHRISNVEIRKFNRINYKKKSFFL